jgi:outer membrane protein, heavy metal efflux system
MQTTRRRDDALSLHPRADGFTRSWVKRTVHIQSGVFTALMVGAVASAFAADTPPFPQLLRQSLEQAPLLLEQAANVRAAGAMARQSRAWSNPSISIVKENLGAPTVGGIQREDTYTLTQSFELGGKRAARTHAEERKFNAAVTRRRQAEVELAAELAVAYASAEAAQRRTRLAKEDVARAQDELFAAQALVKAGREAALRVAQARASVAAATAAQQVAEADGTEALLQLSVLAGAKEPFTNIEHPFLAQAADLQPDVGHEPDEPPAVATAVAEREALAAQVRVEQKRWLPDLSVSAGWRKFGGTGDSAKTVGVALSLPLFDRNQGGIDAAQARVAGAEARVEAARLEAQAHHRAALARVDAADKRLAAALAGESAAMDAYRMGRAGYEAGKTPLVELLAIRRALAEAQTSTVEAQLERVRVIATLAAAEGRIAFGEAK